MSDQQQTRGVKPINIEVEAAGFLRKVFQFDRDRDAYVHLLTLERERQQREAQRYFRIIDQVTRRAHDLHEQIAPMIGRKQSEPILCDLDTFFGAVEALIAQAQRDIPKEPTP